MLKTLSAFFVVLIVAACAGSGPTTEPTAVPATTGPQTVTISSGGYFVGPNGMSLYTFDKDSLGNSSCKADCLATWPPLTVESTPHITVGPGLDLAEFTAITGDNGSVQVRFKLIPLHFYAGDQAVGDVNGDGVGGNWHLATITSTLPSPAPSTEPTAAAAATPNPDDRYTPAPSSAATPAASEPASDVMVNVSPDGDFLVDGLGMSLYLLDDDPPGEATCTGDCNDNWPAFTVADADALPIAGEGVDGTFATLEPSAGTYQVTYNDQALYYYSGDIESGDTNGDGIGDVWHLASSLSPVLQ